MRLYEIFEAGKKHIRGRSPKCHPYILKLEFLISNFLRSNQGTKGWHFGERPLREPQMYICCLLF